MTDQLLLDLAVLFLGVIVAVVFILGVKVGNM